MAMCDECLSTVRVKKVDYGARIRDLCHDCTLLIKFGISPSSHRTIDGVRYYKEEDIVSALEAIEEAEENQGGK